MRRPQHGSRRTSSTSRRSTRSSSPMSVSTAMLPCASLHHRPRVGHRPNRGSLSNTTPCRRGRKKTCLDFGKPAVESLDHVKTQPSTVYPTLYNPVETGEYRCKICGNRFERALQLKVHLLEHGTDRPFPCLVCNVRFTTKWNLMKHQKCRAHRVTQARSGTALGVAEKPRPGRHILPKRRKICRLPTQLVCEMGSPQKRDCENSEDHDSAVQKLLQLEVLPFSSPIATQLQTIQLNELLATEIKPFTMINGTLALELPANHIIRLPVRLRYDDVAKCLTTLNNGSITTAMRPGSAEPMWSRLVEQKSDAVSKTTQSSDDNNSNTGPNFAAREDIGPGVTTSVPSSLCDTLFSTKPVNGRTQEEIQAAKTILSLAHGARIPSPASAELVYATSQLDSSKPSEVPTLASVPEPKPRQRQQSGTTPVKTNRARSHTPGELLLLPNPMDAAISNTNQPGARLHSPDPPHGTDVNRVDQNGSTSHQSPNMHTNSPRGLSADSGHASKAYPAPCAISPKQPKSPRLPIRLPPPPPPPKKRVLANYRQPIPVKASGTSDSSLSTESSQRDRHGQSSPAHKPNTKPASVTTSSIPITSAVTATSDSTVFNSALFSRVLSNGASSTLTGPNYTEPNTSPPTTATITTGGTAIVSGTAGQPSIPTTPNLFILPQLMLFPRIISPYIPMSPNSGMMTPCYLVQSDGTARLASSRCTVTASETMSAVRLAHSALLGASSQPSAFHAVFPPNSSLSKPGHGSECAPLSQVDRPSLGSPKNVVNDTECSNSETSLGTVACSPRLIDSYAPHVTRNLNGPPILRPLASREETSCRRTELQPRASNSGLGSSRLLASCRNKYRCYECGVVCHKPCLLRKHYRTHSNVRPYFCRHCDISFKTRGNLSKHMKSKGHRDRCVKELGLDQVPLVVDDQTQIDRQALERQHQLAFKREHAKRDGWRSRYRAIRAKCPLRGRPLVQGHAPGSGVLLTRPIRSKKLTRNKAESGSNADHCSQPSAPVLQQTPVPVPGGHEMNGRIPAPNVNAVNLLQDLPLNLSIRSRQPALLMSSYTTELTSGPPTHGPSPGGWLGAAMPTTNGILHPPYAPPSDPTDPEEVVRTAVAAARTLNNGNTPIMSIDPVCDSNEASPVRPDFTGQSSASADAHSGSHVGTATSPAHQSPSRSATGRTASQTTRLSNRTNPQPLFTPTATTTTALFATPSSELTCPKSLIAAKSNHTSPSNASASLPTSTLRLLPRGLRPDALPTPDTPNGGNLHDPRPYKCLTCRVGFRVTGHLHKHFRAKSHLLNELHAHKLAPEVIEYVRLNRISVNQFVNPDTGRLRAKAVERIVANRSLNGAGGPNASRTPSTSSADLMR